MRFNPEASLNASEVAVQTATIELVHLISAVAEVMVIVGVFSWALMLLGLIRR